MHKTISTNRLRKTSLGYICIFLLILFRYLSIWQIISAESRYLLLIAIIGFTIIDLFKNKKIRINSKTSVIIIIISLIDFLMSGEIDIFITGLVSLLFLHENNDKKLISVFTISSTLLFILTIILNKIGIIQSVTFIRNLDGTIINRDSLGFTNVNQVFLCFFPIITGLYLLIPKNKVLLFSLFIFAICLAIYSKTNSRTGLYSISIFLIMINVLKNRWIDAKIIPALFVILTILSFTASMLFGKDTNNWLNQALTMRPFLNYTTITTQNISLFGADNLKFDNTYLWLIYRHGIMIYIFYLYIIVKATKNKIMDIRLLNILIVFFIYSLFENTLNYAYNIHFMLLTIYSLTDNNMKYIEAKKIR